MQKQNAKKAEVARAIGLDGATLTIIGPDGRAAGQVALAVGSDGTARTTGRGLPIKAANTAGYRIVSPAGRIISQGSLADLIGGRGTTTFQIESFELGPDR